MQNNINNNDYSNSNIDSYFNMSSNNFTIDTGAPRHIYGHAVSGAVAVGVVSAIVNAKKVKEEKVTKQEAIRDTLKSSIVGGIATATAVSVANNLGDPKKSIFQTLGSLALGAGAVYAIEKASDLQVKKELVKEEEK